MTRTVSAPIFEEQRSFADVLAQGGERPVARLRHDGAFGDAGGRRGSSEAGAQGVAGVVAGDAGLGDKLFDHQGYRLGCQTVWVDSPVPVHGAEERSFGGR